MTIAPENGRTAIPVGEMIVNGTETAAETAAIADAETTMTGHLDAIGSEEICLKKDLDETAETVTVSATAATAAIAATGEKGGGVHRHLLGRGKRHPT